jgi:hypothetical protein
LRKIGFMGLLVSLLISGSRLFFTHSWEPNSIGSVISFFIAELFLAPFSVLLIIASLLWYMLERRDIKWLPIKGIKGNAVNLLIILIISSSFIIVGLLNFFLFPVISRQLQLGRYGYWPPVEFANLNEITKASAMRFPQGAVFEDGEFMGGFHPYLIAKVQIPKREVDLYFKQQVIPFSWSQIVMNGVNNTASFFDKWELECMRRRGWDPQRSHSFITARANTAPTGSNICDVFIDLDNQHDALIYIYWEST